MLNPTTILIKTAKGEEEIRSGEHDIMPDQRIALNFIDGKSSVSKLLKKAAPSLRSSLPKLLETLSIEGFARDISQPENNKGKLKIAIPRGKAATNKKFDLMLQDFEERRREPFHYEAKPYGKIIIVTLSPIIKDGQFVGCVQPVQLKEEILTEK